MLAFDIREINLQTNQKLEEEKEELDQNQNEQLNQQMKELGLKMRLDGNTVADRKEIYLLLNHYMSYPSTQLAETHRQANKLGVLDVDKEERYQRISSQNRNKEEQFNGICKCCGFLLQEKELSVCQHSFQKISNLGIATYLYFKTIINLAILLLILFLIYSLYSLITNITAAGIGVDGTSSSAVLNFFSISLGSKQLYASPQKSTMYIIGAWIGLAVLVFWAIAFMALKYNQKEREIQILMETKSVSQFSLVIQNIPTGVTRQQLEKQLKAYVKTLKQTQQLQTSEIEVVKYNQGQPFYFNEEELTDKELTQILKKQQFYLQRFKCWIKHRKHNYSFPYTKTYRLKKYEQYEEIIRQKKEIVKELTEKIKKQYHRNNKEHITTSFVTFQSNYQKNVLLEYNPDSIWDKLKRLIPFFPHKQRFVLEKQGQKYDDLRFLPAPDPEDIIWKNIGVRRTQICGRKLLTYSITALILGISFVIAYSLSRAQASNHNNRILSLIISLSIATINVVIGLVIEVLTMQERDYTMTNYQISMSLKSILAQLINSIFIPIMANYFIKDNIYYQNGLIEDVFILGIATSLVYPMAKLINPSFILFFFYAKWKLMPGNKMDSHQYEVNQINQKIEFQIGYEYIYITNLFIFTCFFVSLQPIIPLFSMIGLVLIYWIQKGNLYHRAQRPVPGTPAIHTAVSQIIYFGAVAYTLGSMTWANFLPGSQFKAALLPNLVALVAALIIFLLPYESLFRRLFKSKRMPQVFYNENRIFFTSEYDRLNPSTAEQGVQDYYAFLQQKIRELEDRDLTFKSRLSFELGNVNRPNFYKQPQDLHLSASRFKGKNLVDNLLRKQTQNGMTPQLIASVLMRDKKSPGSDRKMKMRVSVGLHPKKNLFKSLFAGRMSEQVGEDHQSKERLPRIERTESIKVENEEEVQEENYTEEQDEYFKEIEPVRSFIIKTESKVEEQKPSQIRQSLAPSIHDSPIQKLTKMQRFSAERVSWEEAHDEVPNRFSFNVENMLPICIQEELEEESQVFPYNMATFQ